MKFSYVLYSAAWLAFLMVPAARAAATKNFVIEGFTGESGGHQVVFQTNPPQHHVILEHKPITLVPVASIPSYSITDSLSKFWGSISSSVGAKIQAVGDFFRGPPRIVVINATTKKPEVHKPSVVLEVGVPQHRVYPWQVPIVLGG